MLKAKWIDKKIKYDGRQLRSLYSYLEHEILGNSVISFRGPCDVSLEHMVDGEDFLDRSKIQGSDMVHFIFEIFDCPIFAGVLLQRLFASIVGDVILTMSKKPIGLRREGDDLYLGKKKLSISIATRSVNSCLVHFAVNVTQAGTPVPTMGLADLGISPKEFAKECLNSIQTEYESILNATMKVKSV